MKKYPITYKGKEYEVRWENDIYEYFSIYEVKEIKIFKKFKIRKYIKKYSSRLFYIHQEMNVSEEDPNYHIEEVKTLFKMWEDYLTEKELEYNTARKQVQLLEEWDGVIDG